MSKLSMMISEEYQRDKAKDTDQVSDSTSKRNAMEMTMLCWKVSSFGGPKENDVEWHAKRSGYRIEKGSNE